MGMVNCFKWKSGRTLSGRCVCDLNQGKWSLDVSSSHLRVGHLWRCCEVLRVATIHGHRACDVNHRKWSHNVSSSHLHRWSLLAGGDVNQHGKW